MRVLLNGVGRIGKSIVRILNKNKNIEIVAINELNSNIENIAYSINYDSTYGRFKDPFETYDKCIQNSKNKIIIFNEENLENIDFIKHNIDIVIDASGSKIDINKLKKLNLKAIFLTHPNKNADINIVLGVNEEQLDVKHKIISTSSCNATALLPVLKVIDDNYKIEYGNITTVHPLLNHQKVLDSGCVGSTNRDISCNFEFGRSSTQNIIPSKTTTIDACSYVLEKMNKDIFSSSSLRVPTATVGEIDITLFVNKFVNKEGIIDLLKRYEENQKFDILLNNDKSLVSSDFQGLHFTSIVDHRFTDTKMGKMIKLVVWYDNEWGYASKVVDILKFYNETKLNIRD